MNGDPDRKTWVERPNQPPKPECCRTEGQAQASAAGAEDRTTVWKAYTGRLAGLKRESHPAKAIQPRNDTKQCRWGRRRITGTQGIRKEPGEQSGRPGEAAQEQELSRSTGASKVHPQG